ncbi:phosphoenolpyruvate carboxylase [Litorimonas sp. WD9-15]|uniref:phosphoenolpyruvate carboxylase n=1 Tax=Litorimonas sp. WD9-15 TaxID=3418716 RepID=UPI003CFFC1B5
MSTEELQSKLETLLDGHKQAVASDPQANPVKLLAYDISKAVEERSISFGDITMLVKTASDRGAISRIRRLRQRAGADRFDALKSRITEIAEAQAAKGFEAFKTWAETPGQGIVLTAHPTFSLSRDIRNTLGEIASADRDFSTAEDTLKTHPYLPKRAPTLIEEHEDTQATLTRIQSAMDALNATVLDVAAKHFPKHWTTLTPHLVDAYSWVGYDIDGRTDISWGDALRLRLSEKRDQLARYAELAANIASGGNFKSESESALDKMVDRIKDGLASAERDLKLFEKDLDNPDNLVAAANNLTRQSPRRFTDLSTLQPLLETVIKGAPDDSVRRDLLCLRASMEAFGLGTARIHFRLNARHVMSGVKGIFGLTESSSDTRTVLKRATEMTQNVKPQTVNFASLALESSTAHEKMILIAQMQKYIDGAAPIRLLIAETEDALVPLSVLYLARRYGVADKLDISPLFETADALNNGGRIIGKMLENDVYRDYIRARGVFAIQTGFSDAGRFMGQIPATLAIERLQSHFAREMARYEMDDVTALVFNTHGEGLGRGGHPGTIEQRLDYAMSPWAIAQFEKRDLHLCHETSFQGGDGYLWFQTEALANATVFSLIGGRYADRSDVANDPFYTEKDFSWDVYRTIGSEQDALYSDPNYVGLLGGLGQNMLIPTGSRAAKRAKPGSGADMFNPRLLRAIPHNAILQQFGTPANIFYGVGRAAGIDPEKFEALYKESARAKSIFGLVMTTMGRTNLSVLTGYGRLFDPGFWISRALSGAEPMLAHKSLVVAETLESSTWRSQIVDLSNRLRLDMYDSLRFLKQCDPEADFTPDDSLMILHALRLAVIMKMMILMTELPVVSDEATSRLSALQRMQTFQINEIIEDLRERYPAKTAPLEWTMALSEKTGEPVSGGGFEHIADEVIKPLDRAKDLVRQITIAITHHYDAFG